MFFTKKIFLLTICFILSFQVWAAPSTIYIIRHGDKLVQPTPGPTLSAKGILRSVIFAQYFMQNYGEPDVIIASAPEKEQGKGSSIRELQTVAPLANILAAAHPDNGFNIYHPFKSSDFLKLANVLLNNANFLSKKILICWDHKMIPQLAQALGVNGQLIPWGHDDFDSIYILKYDTQGKIVDFKILNKQYPVITDPTWSTFLKLNGKEI